MAPYISRLVKHFCGFYNSDCPSSIQKNNTRSKNIFYTNIKNNGSDNNKSRTPIEKWSKEIVLFSNKERFLH